MMLSAVSFLSPTQTLTFRHGGDHFAKSLCIILIRGFVISALYFMVFWPIAIAITAPLYGRVDMHGTWTPEIIKTIFGGLLGLFMNPLIAALVLGARQPAGESTPEVTESNVIPVHITHPTSQPNPRRQSSTFSHTRTASTTLPANSPGISVPRLQSEIA
ncbi:hypothetical protein JB92DRAFT_2960715 [Gautieria morchelliformis]|nr:hypothetical protein JB92DRAFT_2960715 [Gautieria morchelliformis]